MTCVNGNQQLAVNVFGVRSTSGDWDVPRLSALNLALIGWHASHWRTAQSNEVALRTVTSRDLSVVDSWVVATPVVPQVPGTVVSPAMPSQVTFVVKFTTGLAGRSNRGRSYWVGLPESNVTGDYVSSAIANVIVAAWTQLRTVVLPALNAELVVISRQTGGAPRTTGVANAVTNVLYTDLRVDTQRRRLTGEGS